MSHRLRYLREKSSINKAVTLLQRRPTLDPKESTTRSACNSPHGTKSFGEGSVSVYSHFNMVANDARPVDKYSRMNSTNERKRDQDTTTKSRTCTKEMDVCARRHFRYGCQRCSLMTRYDSRQVSDPYRGNDNYSRIDTLFEESVLFVA